METVTIREIQHNEAFEKASSIGAEVTSKTGCRILDLLHVAIAVLWGCPIFVSADERQLAAAKMQGLKTVGLRTLRRRRGDAKGEQDQVREPRTRYASKKRTKKA